ncbi:MAG: type IX secretion system protein PorQ [Paludibacteraceae bacterium]|nr:type IX secretion system protein PorQ [Paludibacteraceae bacterium]
MNKIQHFILVACLLLVCIFPSAGQGVRSPYGVLSLPFSSRLNALGGSNVAISDGEVSMAIMNPALLSERTDKVVEAGYSFVGSGLNFGALMYSHNFGDKKLKDDAKAIKTNYVAVAISFLDYGKMRYADEVGNIYGTFTAKDFGINLTYARRLGEHFTIGATLKPIYSVYEAYTSFALGADVGGHFHALGNSLQVGIVLQNIGWQLKSFYSENGEQHREDLPLNLQLGISYKLEHAPLRFSLTAHHIQQWNIGYNAFGNKVYTVKSKSSVGGDWTQAQQNGAVLWHDMLFRHLIFAIDIVPKSERFYLTVSYNHRRNRELTTSGSSISLAGLAFGAGIKIKQFRLGFGMSQYTRRMFTYQVTLSTDINEFLK